MNTSVFNTSERRPLSEVGSSGMISGEGFAVLELLDATSPTKTKLLLSFDSALIISATQALSKALGTKLAGEFLEDNGERLLALAENSPKDFSEFVAILSDLQEAIQTLTISGTYAISDFSSPKALQETVTSAQASLE